MHLMTVFCGNRQGREDGHRSGVLADPWPQFFSDLAEIEALSSHREIYDGAVVFFISHGKINVVLVMVALDDDVVAVSMAQNRRAAPAFAPVLRIAEHSGIGPQINRGLEGLQI